MNTLSFGAICVENLKQAKAAGLLKDWDTAIAIIDGCDKGRTPPKPKSPPRTFVPPTPEEVTAYSAEIGYPMDGQAWCDAYAVKGWTVGKSSMKDWKAAVRTWKTQRYGQDGIALKPTAKDSGPRDYTRI